MTLSEFIQQKTHRDDEEIHQWTELLEQIATQHSSEYLVIYKPRPNSDSRFWEIHRSNPAGHIGTIEVINSEIIRFIGANHQNQGLQDLLRAKFEIAIGKSK